MASGALVASFAGLAWMGPATAATTTVGPIDFEAPAYAAGNINGQNGWSKTGDYDVEVEQLAPDFPDASGYGFGAQALRASNAFTDGAFGGQAFSPGLASPAGEDTGVPYFTASFEIGTTSKDVQPELAMSVSPDDGNGGRMSYLRFNDRTDGVDVVFVDVTDAGPAPMPATFNPDVPIATLDRGESHAIKFEIAFVDGPGNDGVGNDVVKIYVDGELKHTGTTWENYYRFDPEQVSNGNVIPTTSKLLFASRGDGLDRAALRGHGYLIDGVRLSSSTTAPVVPAPPKAEGTPYEGNENCADLAPEGVTWEEFKIDAIPDNGDHEDPNSDLVITIANASSQTFDWASNDFDLAAVLVKGSNGGIRYLYPGAGDFSDTGLHALVHDETKENPYHDISHVNFCFQVGGDTQPTMQHSTPHRATPQPATPQPGEPQAIAPQAVAPLAVTPLVVASKPGAEVLGTTLVQGDTLPRTGATATRPLVLAGGLGLTLGLAMLMLTNRKRAIERS